MSDKKRNERGFTTIELLVVILAGAMIVAAGAKLSSTIFGTTKLAETEQSLTALRTNIQYLYSDIRDYSEISNANLIASSAVPQTFMNAAGDAIVNAWSGTVTVAPVEGEKNQFSIAIANIPQDSCIKLGAFQVDTWVSIKVNDTVITRGNLVTKTECSKDADNTITYTSK